MESNNSIPTTVISRLSEKSGILSLSKPVYEHINKIFKSHLQDILQLSREIAEYNDNKTVNTDCILESIVLGGVKKNGEGNFERGRESDKLKLEIDLKEYSEESDFSLFINKSKFKNIVSSIDKNLSDNAISNLHIYSEQYLLKLFKCCSSVLKYTKKKILHKEDIDLVLSIHDSFFL